MQSLSRLHPRSPWKTDGTSGLGKSSRKNAHLFCEFKVGNGNSEKERKPIFLPIVVQRSGKSSRLTLESETLRLIDCDQEPQGLLDDGLARFVQIFAAQIRELFVPRHVQDNYAGYLKWKFLHRVFSSCLQVLATQVIMF